MDYGNVPQWIKNIIATLFGVTGFTNLPLNELNRRISELSDKLIKGTATPEDNDRYTSLIAEKDRRLARVLSVTGIIIAALTLTATIWADVNDTPVKKSDSSPPRSISSTQQSRNMPMTGTPSPANKSIHPRKLPEKAKPAKHV